MDLIRHSWLRRIIYALAALGAVLVLITATPLVVDMGLALAGPWNEAHGDILIVLAGSSWDDNILGESSYLRSVYAVNAWKAEKYKWIVVSGAPGAEKMKEFLAFNGVPPEKIIVDRDSGNTRQNAINCKALLERLPGRKVLLTSDFHMFRARRVFERVGVSVISVAIPDVAKRGQTWYRRWRAFLDVVLETTKIVGYQIRGWI